MEKIIDIIISIFKHYIDSPKAWYKRLMPIFIIMGFICLIDNYFGFSYNLKTNSQLEQIEKIEKIVKETKDSVLIYDLKAIEKQVLYKQPIEDYFLFLSSIKTSLSQSTETSNPPISNENILYVFIHFISSNLVLLLILIYFIFFNKSSKSDGMILSLLKSIFSFLLIPILVFSIIFFLSGIITFFIQPVSDNVIVNTIFNISFQIIILLCAIAIYELNKKLKR